MHFKSIKPRCTSHRIIIQWFNEHRTTPIGSYTCTMKLLAITLLGFVALVSSDASKYIL